jgi:hypothetical protein
MSASILQTPVVGSNWYGTVTYCGLYIQLVQTSISATRVNLYSLPVYQFMIMVTSDVTYLCLLEFNIKI